MAILTKSNGDKIHRFRRSSMSFNEIDQIIRSRRSIRAFTSQAVDNELLKNILETLMK